MDFIKQRLGWIVGIILILNSCATSQEFASDDISFEEEESLFFEDNPESNEQDISVAQEKEAVGELEQIEDEFAEFIEQEEKIDTQVAETPKEQISTEEVILDETSPPSDDLIAGNEAQEEEVLIQETIDETNVEEPITKGIAIEESEVSSSLPVQITDIRYEDDNIYIDTRGGHLAYRSRFNDSTRQLIIEVPNATIIDQLKWPYVMKEFQSDFALLQADQKSKNVVRIVVQMKSGTPHPLIVQKERNKGLIISASTNDLTPDAQETNPSYAQEEDSNTLDSFNESESISQLQEDADTEDVDTRILQARTIEDFILEEHRFYGNKVTLDVRDVKIKDIFYFLLEETGLNIVISDTIPDSPISIRLKEVPWDQALVFIMKYKKLGYTRKGNVIYISTLQDFQNERDHLEQIVQRRRALAPLKMEIIPVSYVQASSLISHIALFRTGKGSITVDADNNALIIYDIDSAIENMKKLIVDLDRTPKQVMIAAKIVEVSENFSRSFGISFNVGGAPFQIAPGGIQFNPSQLLNILPGDVDAGTIGSQFTIGSLPFLGNLEAALGLAETEGTVKVLSSPRIMALNNESASMTQSSESLSFSAVLTDDGSETQIQRTPITLSLSVTPQITNEDSIYLRVNMNRSFEGSRVSQGSSSAAPTLSRTASTRILVKSGQTAVIGGIYENQKTSSLLGLPFLKRIPFVKWLFSQVNLSTVKTELLLFLTPRIVDVQSQGSSAQSISYNNKRDL